MKTQDCPRHYTCNAALCPLDMSGYHRTGEAVCYYLLESGKAGAARRFKEDHIYGQCVAALPRILNSDIQRRVAAAAKTPSRTGRKPPWILARLEGEASPDARADPALNP